MWNILRRLLGAKTKAEAARFDLNLKALDEKNADLDKLQLELRALSQAATKGRAHFHNLSKHQFRPVLPEDFEDGESERIEGPIQGPGIYRGGELPPEPPEPGPKGGRPR